MGGNLTNLLVVIKSNIRQRGNVMGWHSIWWGNINTLNTRVLLFLSFTFRDGFTFIGTFRCNIVIFISIVYKSNGFLIPKALNFGPNINKLMAFIFFSIRNSFLVFQKRFHRKTCPLKVFCFYSTVENCISDKSTHTTTTAFGKM